MSRLRYFFDLPFSSRQRRLAESRSPMSRDDFAAQLATNEFGRAAAGMLWEKLQERLCFEGFSPHPTDDLCRVYGLAEEDLDEDVILAMLNTLHCPSPGEDVLNNIGPINTPKDLIRLVEASCSTASAA
jgi:hypothetical protein